MSLRGRYMIDSFKSRFSSYLKLPCPPYGSPVYWEGVYKKMDSSHVFEWASANFKEELLEYNYQLLDPSAGKVEEPLISSNFCEAINVEPFQDDQSILILGCGNSKLGEDMADHGWKGPLIQVDIVPRLVDNMSERCASLVQDGVMDFLEDDANQLSALDNDSFSAVIDKGLIDSLYCSDYYDQVMNITKSAHRVLQSNGIFIFLSFSRPEFILPHLIADIEKQTQWKDIQVRQLERFLMYRLEKDDGTLSRPKLKGRPLRESLQKRSKRKRKGR